MSKVFEVPESLVKAEQGLNTAMADLTQSIHEVKKLTTISGLFSQAAEQNKAAASAFLETAKQFDAATTSLLKSMDVLRVEISDTRKKMDGTMADLRQFVIKAIAVQGGVVITVTLIGIYFLSR